MKKVFNIPELNVAYFAAEHVVTDSGLVNTAYDELTTGNGVIKLDGQENIKASQVITFSF